MLLHSFNDFRCRSGRNHFGNVNRIELANIINNQRLLLRNDGGAYHAPGPGDEPDQQDDEHEDDNSLHKRAHCAAGDFA